MGVSLFLHSVRLVMGDWRNALRITGLLYLIYAVPTFVFALLFPARTDPGQVIENAGSSSIVALITGILAIVAFVWIAVAWHRYVLLDEVPAGPLPEFDGRRLLSYTGYSLLLGIIGFALSFVISAIVGSVAVPLLNVFGAVITGLLALAAMLLVGYRLAPILPAVSVGKKLTLAQAWDATKDANGPLIILAVISAVASFVIDIPALVLAMAGPIGGFLGMLWVLVTGWVKMIVGVSILTTLYGHYVEGRAIPSRSAGVI